jgi:hypothetical protein
MALKEPLVERLGRNGTLALVTGLISILAPIAAFAVRRNNPALANHESGKDEYASKNKITSSAEGLPPDIVASPTKKADSS